MARPSLLAEYLSGRLAQRGESADEFARRVGINASGLYKLLRGAYVAPSQSTLEKIAAGLGMSAAELLAAAEAQTETDPVEQAIRQRAAEMREVLRGIPRAFWSPVIKSTFDRALDGARDMAELIVNPPSRPPVSRSSGGRIRRPKPTLNGGSSATKHDLADSLHPLRVAAA